MHDQPVAIVTGASSGIGLAVARLLAQRGWGLGLAARRTENLERVARELSNGECDEGRFVSKASDMGDIKDVHALVECVVAHFGRLDGIVNCAGDARQLPIERTTPEVITRAYAVNAIGPACAIHFAWPHLLAGGGGRIVNVSTMGTRDPFPGFFAYAASKAPLNVMARSANNEGKERGVRAFGVAPAAVETPMLRSMFDEATLPSAACLSPGQVGRVIVECVCGERDGDGGKTIFLRSIDGEVVEELF